VGFFLAPFGLSALRDRRLEFPGLFFICGENGSAASIVRNGAGT
jgi:hypothetical protein